MRLAASQVIERPPAEVFRFVATDHFQNHPKWDPAVTSITQTSPGPRGVGTTARLVRTDRGRRVEGTMEVTEYQRQQQPDRSAGVGIDHQLQAGARRRDGRQRRPGVQRERAEPGHLGEAAGRLVLGDLHGAFDAPAPVGPHQPGGCSDPIGPGELWVMAVTAGSHVG